MPVHLSKSGKSVLGPSGKVEKRFKSRAAAKAFMTAKNLGILRSKGRKGIPPPPRRRKS